jgi:hypothetical protein
MTALAATCCEFALSDPTASRRNKGTPFKQACGHEKHDSLCNRCSLIFQVFRTCNDVVAASCVEGSAETDMHVTALQSCLDDVVCYMGHRIRSVQQEKGKAEYVSNIDGQTALTMLERSSARFHDEDAGIQLLVRLHTDILHAVMATAGPLVAARDALVALTMLSPDMPCFLFF